MANKIDLNAIMKRLDSIDSRLGKSATTEDLNSLFADINNKLTLIEQRLDKAEKDSSAEEKERQRSLVFIGLPESKEEKASERAKADVRAVTEVLDELAVEALPVAVYRMGRPVADRPGPRLLKVVMAASVFQRITLSQWKKNRGRMRAEDQWSRLLIRPSLSPEELKLDKEERQRRWTQKYGGGANVTERRR